VGHVRERVRLYYRGQSVSVDALIDTGATMLVLPKRVAEELGVEALGEVEVESADGTVRGCPMGLWKLSSAAGGPPFSRLLSRAERPAWVWRSWRGWAWRLTQPAATRRGGLGQGSGGLCVISVELYLR